MVEAFPCSLSKAWCNCVQRVSLAERALHGHVLCLARCSDR